jgi:hypothetical protein
MYLWRGSIKETHQMQQWTNRPVVDSHHARVGKVTDVLYADEGGKPRFATVKTGLLAERITPLDGAYIAGDGVIVLPYDGQTIKHAPKAPRDHVLTPSVASEVIEHYDIP